MNLSTSSTSRRQSTERIGQDAISGESRWQSRCTTLIHILDDDSLLHVFYLYRPFFLGEDEDDDPPSRLWGGRGLWVRGRWWYRLAHVCKRWRNIILGSTSHLDLSLVCTHGTPVADMLLHSPPLPLIVDYIMTGRELTTEDEEGLIFALKQRDRVLRVRLDTSVSNLQKFIAAMDDEYPVLEHLIIVLEDNSTTLIFPESFQAPSLRHLRLQGFALPIESRLLANAEGLVVLSLIMVHPSTYFQPNSLLQWISLMPQLEILSIMFLFLIPKRDVERQLTHTQIVAPITLPNLRHFDFQGVSTYLEALVHRITTPRLKKLLIHFFNQLTFSVPRLLQFTDAAENLRFNRATFTFSDKAVDMAVYPDGETKVYTLGIVVNCQHLDWQVASMAQISNSLSQKLSTVELLRLQYTAHTRSSEEHNEVDRIEWRKLLRPFRNVKTLLIMNGLVKDLSHSLELEDGDLPLEMLPELQELTYFGSDDTGDAFASFIEARQNAGRPITLVHQ